VSPTLLVAAGGGGDALAALMVGRALGRTDHEPVVASYSWDRYLIDPTPGPRTSTDFTGLRRLTEHAWEVTRDSQLVTRGMSGLAILARCTAARFVLLDPTGGAAGLRTQLHELADYLSADAVTLVDVGGDVAARGCEPGLLSPLADSLALAAVAKLPIHAEAVVAGPGLDGELSGAHVREEMAAAGATRHRLGSPHVRDYLAALDHHPSEATTLLAAAALGVTGRVEIRDSATLVALDADGAEMFVTSCDELIARNAVATALLDSQSLDEAEAIVRGICGRTELDHERTKAATTGATAAEMLTPEELRVRLNAYRAKAASRGVDLVTFRRLTEVLGRREYIPALVRAVAGELAYDDLPLCRL
jgi:hypothetical protein